MSASVTPQLDCPDTLVAQPRRLAYICFQATRYGQASYAHVHEIVNGLVSHNWTTSLFEPRYASSTSRIRMMERLFEFFWLQCRAARRLHDFDLLYCRWHPAGLPIMLYARLLGIPVVAELNGSYKDAVAAYPSLRRVRWLVDTVSRASLLLADEIITVTTGLQNWLRDEIPGKMVSVVANGTNAEVFRPDAPCAIELPPRFVVFVGSLAAWQGIETIIEAAALPSWPKSIPIVVAGEGMLKAEVVKAAGENRNVIYLGTLPYQDVPGLVARSLAALIPKNNILESSITGLSPLKLYESAACGVPVIVTDLPGMADFVRENACGLVIPCESPVALAEAVLRLASNPEEGRAMSARARQVIVSGNTWAHRAAATAGVLIRCCGRKGL